MISSTSDLSGHDSCLPPPLSAPSQRLFQGPPAKTLPTQPLNSPSHSNRDLLAPKRSTVGVSPSPGDDLAVIRRHRRFSLVRVLTTSSGLMESWEPRDRTVLQALTRFLQARVQGALSRNCFHLKGHGGTKGIGIASSTALDTIEGSLKALCRDTANVMIDSCCHVMVAWVKK